MTDTDFQRESAADASSIPTMTALRPRQTTSNGDGFQARTPGKAALRRCLGLIAVGLLLGGCGNIEPWVKPYERQAFADPIMAMDANPVSSSYIDHVYEARESARGAMGSSGGGCGCN